MQLWQRGGAQFDEVQGMDWNGLSRDGAMTKAPRGGEKPRPHPYRSRHRRGKRRRLTEGHGIPIGLALEGANRPDMQLVRPTLDSLVVKRPQPTEAPPQGMGLDKGYDDQEVRDSVEECGCTAPIRSRGEEAQARQEQAGQKARRWVVERTHAWMNRCRRLVVRWDKKPEHSMAFLHFACALIAFRAAGLFG